MGTRIEAAAVSYDRAGIFARGALHMSDVAAERCLKRAHRHANQIDLLINAGIYKNRNAAEPALASIIQEDIGANAVGPPSIGRHGTFSFDIINGGCGVTTAAQLLDGFIAGGCAQLGMIVAADADPSPTTSRGFPFTPAGGAVLLSHVDGDRGFEAFETRTFPEDAALFEATLRWDPHAGLARRGHNVVEVREAPALRERCVEHAGTVAGEVLARAGLTGRDIDLLIASQHPSGFAAQLASRLGIPPARVPPVSRELSRAHTAGPIAALAAALESGAWDHAKRVLFVTAGAGVTIGVALYRC